jgi:hypothetical protein
MTIESSDLEVEYSPDENGLNYDLNSADQYIHMNFTAGSKEAFDMNISKGDRGTLIGAYLDAQSGLQQAMVTAQATYAAACVEGQSAMEVARLDAVARCYEADQAYASAELAAETDRYVVDQETEVEMAKLEIEQEKIELEYYRIQHVDKKQAEAAYNSSLGDMYEGQGEYEYDSARAAAKLQESGGSSLDLTENY